MSYLSLMYGAGEQSENVKVGSYVLCRDCSRGIHDTEHSSLWRCQCDLCTETVP